MKTSEIKLSSKVRNNRKLKAKFSIQKCPKIREGNWGAVCILMYRDGFTNGWKAAIEHLKKELNKS